MHGPQAHSSILAPALIRSESAPFSEIIKNVCLEPGLIVRLTSGWTLLPLSILTASIISMYDELTQLPIHTCLTGVPAISLTKVTLSGLEGAAIKDSRVPRDMLNSSSY